MSNISYTITSSTGEEHFSDVPVETALESIKELITKQSKWLYVDQDQETVETITAEKLAAGEVIMLTDMLGGG